MKQRLLSLSLLLVGASISFLHADPSPAEMEALKISAVIQQRHIPFGGILDPIFVSPDSEEIASYTRCGDSAIWTGHYLAAESFHYSVTRTSEALDNARRAVNALRDLVDVTGTDLLARCVVPIESQHAPGIVQEEKNNGIYTGNLNNTGYFWIGNTSRDQYSGVFFGLAVAWDLIDEPSVRANVKALVTRLLDFLQHNNWAVVMPGGGISTVFWIRPDQQLSFLQIGRHINPNRFSTDFKVFAFSHAASTIAPIGVEVASPYDSYFKFNLDTINLYSLIRWEEGTVLKTFYKKAYDVLRNTTDDHGNAHFNMIDRALRGPNAARDAETRALLVEWLKRPRRDVRVDLRGVLPSCSNDNRACQPIPVAQRVSSSFVWEISPFQLSGGGDGFIEETGIDYILPYWMARAYGVLQE